MRKAIDAATGDEVSAADVVERRAYTCPSCGHRVVFRGGQINVKHFAHAKHVADESCELYFSPGVSYTGRRYPLASVPQRAIERFQVQQLAFGVGPDGPFLTLCLPPSGTEPWAGVLYFEHPSAIPKHRRAQTIRFLHLTAGCRVTFPLVEGKWSLTPSGVVPEEYLSRLSIGSPSLESAQNLFDATRDLGKQILPGMAVTAGDTLWWLARQPISVPAAVAHAITLSLECEAYGWFVYRVSLAPELPLGRERDALAQWLQRPVRPRRARVWIEQPWAVAHSAFGVPVYCLSPERWVIRSDRPVDVTIAPARGGAPVLTEVAATEITWNPPEAGSWELRINEREYDLFEVVRAPINVPYNLRIKVNGRDTESVAAAQRALDDAPASRVCVLELCWRDEGVGKLIRAVGPARLVPGNYSTRAELSAGGSIEFENLGRLARSPVEEVNRPPPEALAALRTRAVWLYSLATRASQPEHLAVPARWQSDPIIRRLVGATWESRFAPHVRAFQRLLAAQS